MNGNELVVKAILQNVYENLEVLSTMKFSGVHYVEEHDMYRVHATYVLPKYLAALKDFSDLADKACSNIDDIIYDKSSNWFTFIKS
jgi:hypothetical protein